MLSLTHSLSGWAALLQSCINRVVCDCSASLLLLLLDAIKIKTMEITIDALHNPRGSSESLRNTPILVRATFNDISF